MKLSYEALEWRTLHDNSSDVVSFPPAPPFFGQERARAALELALRGGFHAYLVGPSSLGKHEALLAYLSTQTVETPPDLLYVPLSERKVAVLTLPSGQETHLADAVENLLLEVSRLDELFRQGSFLREKTQLEARFKEAREQQLASLQQEAQEAGFALSQSGERLEFTGPGPVPAELSARLEEVTLGSLAAAAELEVALRRLRRDWALHYLNNRFEPLFQRFPQARSYLEALRGRLARYAETGEPLDPAQWRPNLLTSSSSGSPPPIVYEPYATAPRLFGRLDYVVERGVWSTNVSLIRPGAVHRAQGGYLILDALSLKREGTWEAFKRALRNGQVEPVTEPQAPASLEVEPFPIQMQVMLVGNQEAFESLEEDPAFSELFRIRVEFSPTLPATPENMMALGGWLQAQGFQMTHSGLIRLYDEARRSAEQRDRMDARLIETRALAEEAAVLGEGILSAEAVEQAVLARDHRSFLSEEEFLRAVREGVWSLRTTGRAVGEVNSLVVVEAAPYWGRPARLTARAAPGRDHLVSIDREAGLGGQIFHKAVLTLAGYLRGRYIESGPLPATVSLAFEQSYVSIDGDSAGLAELVAVLSAIGNFPLRQDLAVTGAVDQTGKVLAVGAINAKVEGFFRVCQALGLSGSQGVILPRANIPNLTLRAEVLEAVRAGQFHIYAVETAEQALELLAGARMEGFRGLQERIKASLEEFAKLEEGHKEENES
ncbi:AAA family ATPase [Meiothermus hypogaeus]|uniref:endopeptidase La n=2 Tax=Meiothermus hypogaeus TaxID=884155 RepID=A0A511R471_9DEIN|nr:AAA family ATPase [Meiothermus hypogaeus]RIH79674.1 Lon protease [Meiothermus hypogaeus]GEM83816.1 ATP-dependent protease [Meiothermus hypogaeus NBRC 106114]GIW37336.1 MAG: ATP-dependent protease [Meiothermus sp.]